MITLCYIISVIVRSMNVYHYISMFPILCMCFLVMTYMYVCVVLAHKFHSDVYSTHTHTHTHTHAHAHRHTVFHMHNAALLAYIVVDARVMRSVQLVRI